MTAKKPETKSEKVEREYIIPLRRKYQHVARYKKTPKAIKIVKEFLVRHMKVYDRDLNKIKIDRYLNEYLWFRGIRNPPFKVKIKVYKEGEIVRAELAELPTKLKFKKLREEKLEKTAEETKKKKKTLMEKAKEGVQKKPEEVEQSDTLKGTSEKKEEEKEKKAAVVEAGQKMEKAKAKEMRQQKGGKTKEPKRQKRVALAK